MALMAQMVAFGHSLGVDGVRLLLEDQECRVDGGGGCLAPVLVSKPGAQGLGPQDVGLIVGLVDHYDGEELGELLDLGVDAIQVCPHLNVIQ